MSSREADLESTLHQQLKDHYSNAQSVQEVRVDGFRIDVRRGRELIEIQTSGLGAIRDKIRALLPRHRVRVVKPIVARKFLRVGNRPNDPALTERWSPKRCGWLDLFDELTHFTSVFPHRNLTIDVPLIEIAETRYRRKVRRYWHRAYRTEDQRLMRVIERRTIQTSQDLVELLGVELPESFGTRELAELVDTQRWLAQKIAFCLRQTGAATIVEKRGNALVYRLTSSDQVRSQKRRRGQPRKTPRDIDAA